MSDLTRVRDILNIPFLRTLKLLAGNGGLGRLVDHVTVMEVPDTALWLNGGDFVITSFYACKDDIDAQCQIVKDLAEKGCAALAIKTGQYVIALNKKVLDIADKLDFPILEIPFSMTYVQVIDEVMQLTKREHREHKQREKFLKDILLRQKIDRGKVVQRGLLLDVELEDRYFNAITIGCIKTVPTAKEKIDIDKCADLAQLYPATRDYVLGQVHPNHTHTLFLYARNKEELVKLQQGLVGKIRDELAKAKHVRLALGGIHFGVQGIRTSYFESRDALSSGRDFFSQDLVYSYEELEVFSVLREKFLDDSIYTMEDLLKKIDNQDLINTLLCFFHCSRIVDDVASALFVHRNTVNYRLQRIFELTGLDVKKSRDSFVLYNLSLYYQAKYGEAE